MLPTDYDERKALPVYTFLTEYFPLAFLEVVRVAVAGDKQHLNNPGSSPIRWAREKSTDQMNTALRHIMDYGAGVRYDADGRAHLAKAIWRLSAQLQLDEERARGMHCGCKKNGVPITRETCFLHGPKEIQTIVAGGGAGGNAPAEGSSYGVGGSAIGGVRRAPVICGDCGADLDETGHFASCLSQAAHTRQGGLF